MRSLGLSRLAGFRLFCVAVLLAAASPAVAQLTVSGFTNYSHQGFDILVSDQALAEHRAEVDEAIAFLEERLGEIVRLNLAPDIIADFRQVPIFMEWDLLPGGSAWYHPSAAWLAQNGYMPEKAKAVEINNIRNFVDWSKQNQPMLVLHELAHAYHDQVLGFGHPGILERYKAAARSGIYESVPYNPGSGATFNQQAYALTNEVEYFAELTEAFFGENDYYPFVRSDIERHDPEAYALLQEIWRPARSVATERPAAITTDVQMYPNPSTGRVTVKVPGALGSVAVYNLIGRQVYRADVGLGGEAALDLRGQPAGLYVVHVSNGEAVDVQRLILSR
ncbi:MAG: T9SS type A sorting domain-containing protein [Bacteroidota bacterium]